MAHPPIKTGICSFGMSGKVFHGPFLHVHPDFDVRKIWQRTKNDAKEAYPEVEIVRTLEELLSDDSLELIVVNTPEPTHYKFTKAVLEAGKHAIVEKAFTITSAEAEELTALAKAKGKVLSVYQNRRWDGDFLTVKKIVEEGSLGRLVEFESNYQRYRNFIQEGTWKEESFPGSGIVYNLGSHLMDQVLTLFGKPTHVFADLAIQRTGGKVYDHFEIILFYEGFKATVKAGYLIREEGPRYKLLGTEGSFVKYGIDPQEQSLKDGIMPNQGEAWGKEPESDWGIVNTTINGLHLRGKTETLPGNYMTYYQSIYEAIREGKEPAVTAEQGTAIIKLIEAVYRSFEEKRVITLGEK